MGPFQAIARLGRRSITRRILHPLDVSLGCFRFVDRSQSGGTGGEGERRGRKAISTTESRGEGGRQRGGREETAAAIGFSLMLIERVTAVGDSRSVSLDAGVESRVSEEGWADQNKGGDGYPIICDPLFIMVENLIHTSSRCLHHSG